MSDRRLRQRQRRWATSGSELDEGRLLQERVRAGELAPEVLAVVAYAGHPGVLGADGGPGTLRGWVEELWRFAPRYRRRVWLRLAESVVCGSPPSEHDALSDALLRDLEAWIDAPDEGRRRKLTGTSERLPFEAIDRGRASTLGVHAVYNAVVLCTTSTASPERLQTLLSLATHTHSDEGELLDALRRDLIDWSLSG